MRAAVHPLKTIATCSERNLKNVSFENWNVVADILSNRFRTDIFCSKNALSHFVISLEKRLVSAKNPVNYVTDIAIMNTVEARLLQHLLSRQVFLFHFETCSDTSTKVIAKDGINTSVICLTATLSIIVKIQCCILCLFKEESNEFQRLVLRFYCYCEWNSVEVRLFVGV